MKFCNRTLGQGQPPFIVAEVGFNHNGDVELAKAMIRSAHDHGADAVKLQTFSGEHLYAKSFLAPDPDAPDNEIPFYEFWKRYELSRADYATLFAYARELGIPLFSTPFDPDSLAMLLDLGMPAIKIASGDLTYRELLEAAGASGVPVVLSSGMADETEVEEALNILKKAGAQDIVLLHCVSNYPAASSEMNLACLPQLEQKFHLPVGLSDHSQDAFSATVATSLGAVMIEKHFTTDRNLPGVDQALSMEPQNLRDLRQAVDRVVTALGDGEKKPQVSEQGTKKGARRSVVAITAIPKGTTVTADMLGAKRPGTGIPSEQMEKVVGRTARQDIPAETLLTWEMF